jgi:thiamine kinase-like enzyme
MAYKLNFKYYILFFLTYSLLGTFSTVESTEEDTNKKISLSQALKVYPQFSWMSFKGALESSNLCCKSNDLQISLLKGGLSSDGLFKVFCLSNIYVLRFLNGSHPLEKRKVVSQAYKWASVKKFTPRVQLIDEINYRFILLDFAEGRTLRLEDTQNPKTLQSLGRILSKVHHSLPPKKIIPEFSQFIYGKRWYESAIIENKIIGPSALKQAYKKWLILEDELSKQPPTKVMLHNDLNLRNVLLDKDKKITLLDWELAGLGDPRKEVAHIVAWYGLDEKLTNSFLTAYYGRTPTNKELEVLRKFKIQILLEFAWVGLSTFKNHLDQETWDKYYEKVSPKTIEDLSLIQMQSETDPPERIKRDTFLGLIKQFQIETSKQTP